MGIHNEIDSKIIVMEAQLYHSKPKPEGSVNRYSDYIVYSIKSCNQLHFLIHVDKYRSYCLILLVLSYFVMNLPNIQIRIHFEYSNKPQRCMNTNFEPNVFKYVV